ncbi:hypothetical protein ACHAPJ_007437 [Fusarium lateritium]
MKLGMVGEVFDLENSNDLSKCTLEIDIWTPEAMGTKWPGFDARQADSGSAGPEFLSYEPYCWGHIL